MSKKQEYLIWSIEHAAWWRPGEHGYTKNIDEAGIYDYERAHNICRSANLILGNVPNEALVPMKGDKDVRKNEPEF